MRFKIIIATVAIFTVAIAWNLSQSQDVELVADRGITQHTAEGEPDLFQTPATVAPLASKAMGSSAWQAVSAADFGRSLERNAAGASVADHSVDITNSPTGQTTSSGPEVQRVQHTADMFGAGSGSGCDTCGPAPTMQMQLQPVYGQVQQASGCRHCGGSCGKGGCQLASRLTNVQKQLEYKGSRGVRPFKNNPGPCAECGIRRQITGVDSATCVDGGEPDWGMRQPIQFERFAHGEYIGPARTRHVNKYRVRVDDQLTIVFRITRDRTSQAYELNVGDEVRVEAVADKDLDRVVIVQPDGTLTLRLLGQVMAAGRTVDEVRRDLEKRYEEFYQEPAVTVTPEKMNTKLDDLRATVDARAGNGGQQFQVTVTPDGTIQLPAIGSLPAHGLTLEELKMEIDARYSQVVRGLEATPVLTQRAPRFIYVVGEVAQPGRVELVGPTTVTQAIALAQGWNNGANLRNIVIFRRAEDWRLLATKIDIRGALYGTRPAPSDEIWLRDSDVVIVPKTPIRVLDDAIDLIFTQGIYAAVPFFTDPAVFSDQTSL